MIPFLDASVRPSHAGRDSDDHSATSSLSDASFDDALAAAGAEPESATANDHRSLQESEPAPLDPAPTAESTVPTDAAASDHLAVDSTAGAMVAPTEPTIAMAGTTPENVSDDVPISNSAPDARTAASALASDVDADTPVHSATSWPKEAGNVSSTTATGSSDAPQLAESALQEANGTPVPDRLVVRTPPSQVAPPGIDSSTTEASVEAVDGAPAPGDPAMNIDSTSATNTMPGSSDVPQLAESALQEANGTPVPDRLVVRTPPSQVAPPGIDSSTTEASVEAVDGAAAPGDPAMNIDSTSATNTMPGPEPERTDLTARLPAVTPTDPTTDATPAEHASEPSVTNHARPSSSAAPDAPARLAEHAAVRELMDRADRHRLTSTGSLEVDIVTERFGAIRVEAIDRGEGLQLSLRADGSAPRDLAALADELRQAFDGDERELDLFFGQDDRRSGTGQSSGRSGLDDRTDNDTSLASTDPHSAPSALAGLDLRL